MFRDRVHRAILIGLAGIIALGATYVGYNASLDWLLRKDAEAIGTNWTQYLESNLPEVFQPHPLGLSRPGEPDTQRLSAFADDILSVKTIFQFDLVNPYCQCVASFGSYHTPTVIGAGTPKRSRNHSASHQMANSSHAENDKHGHHDNHAHHDTPPQQSGNDNTVVLTESVQFQHALLHTKPHASLHSHAHSKMRWRLPHDHEVISDLIHSGGSRIDIRWDAPPFQPKVFAEVYYPIRAVGVAPYLMRVLIDFEAKHALYRTLLLIGLVVAAFLVVLFCIYPARKFLQIRHEKAEADERIRYLAAHDPVTGIANRNAFQEAAPRFLEDILRQNSEGVLFRVDIRRFKEINDLYGHTVGDSLLGQIAASLLENMPKGSLIARIGSDEFAMMVKGEAIEKGREQRYVDLPANFEISQDQHVETIEISVATGIARFPVDGTDLQDLMLNADLALMEAKTSRTTRFCRFEPGTREQHLSRIGLLGEFSNALQNGEIVPYYQPILRADTGRICGFEALARWNHPTRGVLAPGDFLPVFDDRETAQALGKEMLEATTRDMASWKRRGVEFNSVGLNVTDADLLRPGFTMDVVAHLSNNGLIGSEFALEITENSLFKGNEKVTRSKLDELRSAGCYIALDDFGTGYSSFTHIKDMPITAVKIDKSFVRNLAHNKADQAIVRSIIDLGRTIGFQLVAEGVETPAQRDLLRKMGCDIVQGFLFSRPVPAAEVPKVIVRLSTNEDNGNVLPATAGWM